MRQKKNQKVEEIEHASGVVVDLMLNPNNLTFTAQVVEGVTFTEKSAQEVRVKVRQYLDNLTKLEWIPVIEVHEQKPFHVSDHAFIGITVDRCYLGRDASGAWRELKWDAYVTYFGRLQTDLSRVQCSQSRYGLTGELVLPRLNDSQSDAEHVMIAYTEASWVALNQIREGIAALKTRLRETLASDAGLKRLEAVGASMLRLLPEKGDE